MSHYINFSSPRISLFKPSIVLIDKAMHSKSAHSWKIKTKILYENGIFGFKKCTSLLNCMSKWWRISNLSKMCSKVRQGFSCHWHFIVYARDGWRYGQTTHHFLIFLLPLFVKEYCTTKVLGIYGTTRCQIKGMDIVFPQVPLNPVLAKWFGYCDSMKYGSF